MKINIEVQESDLQKISNFLDKGILPDEPIIFNGGGVGLPLNYPIEIIISYDEFIRLRDNFGLKG